ncbi:DNA polymerase III subunit chi [Luminiphilus syltensis NOR5-1B]|uniref:DNA polymerase III subunit chi n=1 Tax=Luminiphilus syltensis NOR5-1B TaxID=565045 RepID=B8KR03_9GAMM|nr:DNA polymerase III subunit chi [Luminiphilus syltensis NOR5-1B]
MAEKAYHRGHRVLINADTESNAKTIDDLLWSQKAVSFVPHALMSSTTPEDVTITWGQEPDNHDDVLINLALTAPPWFSRFQRVAEVVSQDPSALAALRDAWRFYRDRGYPLKKHDL